MRNNLKRFVAIAMIAAMSAASFASCGNSTTTESSDSSTSTTESSSSESTESGSVPLVVAYDTFNQKFNPFFATVSYDSDVATSLAKLCSQPTVPALLL